MKLLIINGPNLNLTGKRQPEIYGSRSFESFFEVLESGYASKGCGIQYFQSNSEGEIIDRLHKAGYGDEGFDGIVINPGAYSHYSRAIADAIAAIPLPVVEVHISNVAAREAERRKTVTGAACVAVVAGLGLFGYEAAVEWFVQSRNI